MSDADPASLEPDAVPSPEPEPPEHAGTWAPGLHVAATPIGNLGDASARLRSLLARADLIVAENSPSLRRLATLLGVNLRGEVVTSHEGNEERMADRLAAEVAAGRVVALVSEAGTPAVSDPGFRLVRRCRALGLPVSPVPGPCAAIAALSASGLPSDRFLFVGFLPPKSAARRRLLPSWDALECTVIGYESTHRIASFLDDAVASLDPTRTLAVAREVTKRFEAFHVGPVGAVREAVLAGSTKGEFTWLLAKPGYSLS